MPDFREAVRVLDQLSWTEFLRRWSGEVIEYAWLAALDPQLIEIWVDTGNEGSWDVELLRRNALLSTGTDHFLLDPDEVANGEWQSYDFTSWTPGAGPSRASFRAGLEERYASFVGFDAPGSVTHADVAQRVEQAYRSALRGNPAAAELFEQARFYGNDWFYGNDRADVLGLQAETLGGV